MASGNRPAASIEAGSPRHERQGRWRRGALAAALAVASVVAAAVASPAWRSRLADLVPHRARIALAAWRDGLAVDHDIAIPMPDGVRLRASLYRPARGDGPLPTVLVRLPYHRLRFPGGYRWGLQFAKQGYAVLVQDLRGTGDSGGELLPWRDAESDGRATLDWIVAQPWSDGKVGAFGCSALGETQWPLARARHPALRGMIPSGSGGAVGAAAGRHAYFGLFEGGVFQLASGFGWFVEHGTHRPDAPKARAFDRADHLRRLPVAGLVGEVRPAPNGYADFLATPLGSPRWSTWGYLDRDDRPVVPALVVNTWGDQTVGETFALAEAWRRAHPDGFAGQRIVVGPGDHCGHGGWNAGMASFGDLAVSGTALPIEAWYGAWLDHWLRGAPQPAQPERAYTYFMLGEDRWLAADTWPPAEASTTRPRRPLSGKVGPNCRRP